MLCVQASMDEFSFMLKTLPDRLTITSSLGNMQGVSALAAELLTYCITLQDFHVH